MVGLTEHRAAVAADKMKSVVAGTVVTTSAADDRSLVTPKANAKAWEKWADKLLHCWQYPAILESDEGLCPSREVIEVAIDLVNMLRGDNWPVPDAILPDENGGLMIQFAQGHFEVLRTGHVDFYRFDNGVLVSSVRIR